MSPPSDRPQPNATRLRYFVTVAEEGSLSAASRVLGVSQPALSDALRRLEGELGLQLFERNHDGMRMTESGRELMPTASGVIRALRDVSDMAHSIATDGTRQARLAVPMGFGVHPTSPMAAQATLDDPLLEVRVIRCRDGAEALDAVTRGRVELALVPRLAPPDGFDAISLGRQEAVLAAPAAWRLPAGVVSPAALHRRPVLVTVHDDPMTRLIEMARQAGARPRVRMTGTPQPAVPYLVAGGVGAALFNRQLAASLLVEGVSVHRLDPAIAVELSLVHRAEGLPPGAASFLRSTQRWLATSAPGWPSAPSMSPAAPRSATVAPD